MEELNISNGGTGNTIELNAVQALKALADGHVIQNRLGILYRCSLSSSAPEIRIQYQDEDKNWIGVSRLCNGPFKIYIPEDTWISFEEDLKADIVEIHYPNGTSKRHHKDHASEWSYCELAFFKLAEVAGWKIEKVK